MQDHDKSREQLLAELAELRERTAQLETRLADCERTGAEAHRTEHYHRAILDSIPDIAWVKSLDGRIEAVNQAWFEFAGLRPDEMIGRFDTEFFSPEAVARFREDEGSVIATGKPLYREERHSARDGAVQTFETFKAPLFDSAGRISGTIGISRDITQRKQAEESQRQSEYLQRAILDNIPDPAWVKDLDGRINAANKAWLEFFGLSAEKAIGRLDTELFSPEIVVQFREDESTVVGAGKSHRAEKTMPDQNGILRTFDTFKSPLFDSAGRVAGSIGIAREITERRRAEEALRNSEYLQRAILDNIPDPAWVKGLDGRSRMVNRAWLEFMGMTSDEAIGRSDLEVFPPEIAASVQEQDRTVVELGRTLCFEETVPDRHGSARTFDTLKAPLFDSSGRATGTIGITRDITERKRVEEEFHRTSSLLEALLKQAPIGIAFVDHELRYVVVNERLAEFNGKPVAAHLGKRIAEVIPELASFVKETASRVLASGDPVKDLEIWDETRAAQGIVRSFLVSWYPVRDVSNEIIGFGTVVEETTERKRADEVLRNLSKAVTYSPSMIMITDQLGRVEHVNPAWEQSTGFSLDEVRGQKPRLLKSGLHSREFYAELWDAITAGRVWRGELCNRRKNGELYWEANAIAPVHNNAGVVTHFVAVKEDITSRRQAAEELRNARDAADAASRAKGDFLANMSHEIRTPLNVIIGFSQLLLRDSELSADQHRQLMTIARSGEHLLEIIDAILEVSRIDARRITLNPVDMDLHLLLDDLERMFSLRTRSKQLHFRIERQSDLPRYINADKTKLRQILINLLANAVKFTPTGGAVTLRVHAADEAESALRLHMEVEDSGVGIDPKDMTHLFEPFFQADAARRTTDGTGLGLSISREYVRLFGGELAATSHPGRGSTFRFDVRVTRRDAADVAAQPAFRGRELYLSPQSPACRVLVADDQRENCELIERLLIPIGFGVRTVANGADAVSLCQSWLPDIVVMDLRMPVMDGYEAARQIRAAHGSAVKILALTASAFADDSRRAINAGMDAFLQKPFHGEALLDHIKQLTGVEFLYDDFLAADADSDAAHALPTAESLSRLPMELIDRLHEASLRANYRKMQDLIREVQSLNAPLAGQLRQLVQRFDFTTLQMLLGNPESRESR